MIIRLILVLAFGLGWLLNGCTTGPGEAHTEQLMRHHDWPRIQQAAEAEVNRQEKILGLPTTPYYYLPVEHKEKLWIVTAMSGTPEGNSGRVVTLTISDDGQVLAYQRHMERLR